MTTVFSVDSCEIFRATRGPTRGDVFVCIKLWLKLNRIRLQGDEVLVSVLLAEIRLELRTCFDRRSILIQLSIRRITVFMNLQPAGVGEQVLPGIQAQSV